MPKKPPTVFSLFVMKRSKKFPDVKGIKRMSVFANDWNELSEAKKVGVLNVNYLRYVVESVLIIFLVRFLPMRFHNYNCALYT